MSQNQRPTEKRIVKNEWKRLQEPGQWVDGELHEFRQGAIPTSYGRYDEIILRDLDKDNCFSRLVATTMMRSAVDLARRMHWPERRIYVRFERLQDDDSAVASHRIHRYDVQVALLLPYDIRVERFEEMRKINADGVRVFVKETGLIYRIDAAGSNRREGEGVT